MLFDVSFPSCRMLGLIAGMSACMMACIGCESADHGHVVGKVTLNGKAIEGAEVRFAPEEGRAAWDVTDAEGKYELTYTPGIYGAKTGKNTVTITTATEGTVDDQGRPTRGKPEIFPPDYNTNASHEVDVQPGENEFNFDVENPKFKGAGTPAG